MRHAPCVAAAFCAGLAIAAAASAHVSAVRLASGLSSPTYLAAPPADTSRLFVLELAGTVKILDPASGAANATPFLVVPGCKQLVGLAFHPDYANNGFFYVYYRDHSDQAFLERYTRSAGDPDVADAGSADTLLSFDTFGGHFGGWIGFAPDGLLFVNIGDGGKAFSHDAAGRGQGITGELMGNVLRIDVDGDDFPADPDRDYAIPTTNPFVGIAGEDEIWAYGLRNPFRASIDRATGDLVIGDVGQDNREEIDFEKAGGPGGRNYGWRLREGTIATPTGGVGGPQPPDGVDPVFDYEHGTGVDEGGSVTGGYVYRGPIAELQGKYFFADYVNPRVWSIEIDRDTGAVSNYTDWTTTLTPDAGSYDGLVSFGEDAAGNLYLVDLDGELFRVEGPGAPAPALGSTGAALLAVTLAAFGLGGLKQRRAAAR